MTELGLSLKITKSHQSEFSYSFFFPPSFFLSNYMLILLFQFLILWSFLLGCSPFNIMEDIDRAHTMVRLNPSESSLYSFLFPYARCWPRFPHVCSSINGLLILIQPWGLRLVFITFITYKQRCIQVFFVVTKKLLIIRLHCMLFFCCSRQKSIGSM